MQSVSNTDISPSRRRVGRPLWYFVVTGAVAAAAVITSSLLAPDVYGVAWLAATIAFTLFDRAVSRAMPVSIRLRRGAVVYVVVFGALLVVALVAAAIVARNSEQWVAWALGGLAFVTLAVAGWIVDRRLSETAPSGATPATPPS